jgi:cellulose synthase/poly-beta-1,6-N-acetylglucosamine synthase-like glycosyltransferase
MLAVEIVFWLCVALLVYTHAGYPLALWLLARGRGSQEAASRGGDDDQQPTVALIVAAHDEEDVIADRVRNALALDYPRERLEVVVASDGSEDRTAERAAAAGADRVLELPRAGKIAAQNAAVEAVEAEVLAFSDANAMWQPGALRKLVSRFEDPAVGYVCGTVRFTDAAGDNQEGAYWRYELAVRALESRLGGVTAGNGGIYAVRREAYLPLPASRSHDLSFPFALSKRGWRAEYEPGAVAEEKPVPTLEGEFARKRRMMRGLWDIVVLDGMLSPRGYRPAFAFEIASHRLLRYASPILHLLALAANLALLGEGWVYAVTLAAQLGLLSAALIAPVIPARPFQIARYYVLVTASIAAGLWDRARQGPPAAWERAEGTR